MADVDGRPVPGDGVELLVDLRLGDGVERRGGLVENEERRVLVERPGDGGFLRLAAREVHALLHIFIQIRVEPLRKFVRAKLESRVGKAALCFLPVVLHGPGHVLAQRQGGEPEVLKDHREQRDVVVVAVFPDVDAVQKDLALGGVIQPAQQLDECGLAAAVRADDRKAAADAERDVHVAQRPRVAAGIAERHVPELHLILPVGALFGRETALIHMVRPVEKGKRLAQEQAVCTHEAERFHQKGNAAEELRGRADVPRDFAHVKGAAPRFETDKQVDRARQHRGDGLRQTHQNAHFSL